MEVGEEEGDLFGFAEVGEGVRKGVVVFEAEERREFFGIEFFDANFDVLGEDEVEEGLLFGAEGFVDFGASQFGTLTARDGRGFESDVGEDVKEVAVFGVDDLLHLSELVVAESFFSEASEKCFAR